MPLVISPESSNLGISPVNNQFNFSISITYDDDPTILPSDETVIQNVNFVSEYSEYFSNSISISGKTANINIIGSVPIDVFDNYSINLVYKGMSDISQTPEILSIDQVPDNKDVYKINIDNRGTIIFEFTLQIICSGSVSITRNETYQITISQTYDMIKNWIDDYFKNRY